MVLLQEHRVLIPEEERRKNSSRRVTAFFVHCDNEAMVYPLDGSQPSYKPLKSYDYVMQRVNGTFQY